MQSHQESKMTSKRFPMLLGALIAATVLASGAAVYAQPSGPLWDPTQLPATRGTVKQYTLTPSSFPRI
jgi:hypothetical protein